MPEFDELKLQVTLVDNATAQLRTIKQSLDELGGGSSAQNLERLKRQTSELDEQLRKLVETVSKGPKAFLDLARNVTVAGVSIGTFTLAAEKVLSTVDDLTKKLVELQHVANQTGWDPAKIKQIEEAYARHSISSQQAQQEIQKFAETLEDFSRRYSQTRIQLYQDFPRENEIIQRLVYQAVDAAPDVIQKFNAMKKGAQDVFEYFEKRGDPELGKRIQRDILQRAGIPSAINVDEMVKPIDDAMSANLKHQIEQAETYERTTKQISQNWEEISKFMKVSLMDSGLIDALKWVDSLLEKWRAYQRAQPVGPPTPPPGLPPLGGLPAPGAPGSRAGATGGATGSFFMGGGGVPSGGGGGSGGGMGSIPNIGDLLKPSANPIQVPPRTGPTGIHGWPLSENVEDRRTPELMQSQNDQNKTLIAEIKRLNAILSGEEKQPMKYGMLSMPGAGAGLGGVGGGGMLGGGGGGGAPGGGGGAPGGGGGDGTPGSGTPGTPSGPPSIPGPGGQPMPPWGTTTATHGGLAGGGAAGGVPGLPGGPSGPSLTHEERMAQKAAGGGGGGGGSGSLAQDRERFKKELDADPQLKALAVGAMRREGGLQSNLEQLFNYASMRGMTINQALHSGQYGPVTGRNRIPEATLRAGGRGGEKELENVYGGSNITDYATDQGMRGDPNFAKYMSNQPYWNMHQVEGAWFSSHGERGRQWAQRMREQAAAQGGSAAAAPTAAAPTAAAGAPLDTSKVGVTDVGERHKAGSVMVGGESFGWGSGGAGQAIPYGTYNVDFGGVGPQGRSGWGGRLPPAVAGVTTDPSGNVVHGGGYTGLGIEIHSGSSNDLDRLYTAGCFGIAKKDWPRFKQKLLEEAQRNPGGKLRLTVQPGKYPNTAQAFIGAAGTVPEASGRQQESDSPGRGGTVAATSPPVNPSTALYDTLRKQDEARKSIRVPETTAATEPSKSFEDWRTDQLQNSDPETRRLYEENKQRPDTSADLADARRSIDKLNAPKRVEGKGDINVIVKAEKNGESKSPLKKVDMPVHSSGDKAESGRPASAGATGGGKEASNEINY